MSLFLSVVSFLLSIGTLLEETYRVKYCYNVITSWKNKIASKIMDMVKAYHNRISKEGEPAGSQLPTVKEGAHITRQSRRLKYLMLTHYFCSNSL